MSHFPGCEDEEDPSPGEEWKTYRHQSLACPGRLPEPEVTTEQGPHREQYSQQHSATAG